MRRSLGILSLAQVAAAAAIGLWAIARSSPGVAVGYALLLATAPLMVTWCYCAKCPCRKHGCAHVVPGLLARLFRRPQEPYAPWELAAVFVAMGAICLVPIPWLIGQWGLLALFAGLLTTSVVEIRTTVCRGCGNGFCPLRRAPAEGP